jgi:hypothetical protein
MGRVRVTPIIEEDKLGPNPFEQNLEVWINKKHKNVLNVYGDKDIIETLLEKTPYTKLYDAPLPDKATPVDKLPIRSKELYLHILHNIKRGKDWIWIDRVAYMETMDIKAINTFKDAIGHLATGGYVSKHGLITDLLWINPHFFFKGSRINKFKDKLRWDTPKTKS